MTRSALALRTLLLAAVLVAGSSASASAAAQVFVLESTADTIKVGADYAMADRITVPSGASIRIVTPSGKTQTVRGPYSGPVAELVRGQKANQGVIAWIKNLLQTGGSNERTPGATRSLRAPEPPASFSWTDIPATADSTICIEKSAKPHLRRSPAQRADRITVIDQKSGQRGEVEFAPGAERAPWPQGMAPQPNGSYLLIAPDNRPQRRLTVRILDSLPAEDDTLPELASRNCKYQFDAWVKEKLAAGRRKGS